MARLEPSDRVLPFPPSRELMVDGGRLARGRHLVHGLFEIDVTAPRRALRAHRVATGEAISFTGFAIACLGRAVAADRRVHGYRLGRRRLVLFGDVDVLTLVEVIRGESSEIRPLVVRAADERSVREIHDEIRAFQAAGAGAGGAGARWIERYGRLPGIVRRALLRRLLADPRRRRARMGTVALSSLGSVAAGAFWGLPLPSHTLQVTLGGIAPRPAYVGDRLEPREFLSVTVTVDHDVIDGAPAARFAARFRDLIAAGHGLDALGAPR